MNADLHFTYFTTVKNNKYYVVFSYKDENGVRKKKWEATNLPKNCLKRDLKSKEQEIISDFRERLKNSKTQQTHQLSKPTDVSDDMKFTDFLDFWLKTIKPTIAETTYDGYLSKINSIKRYFDETYPNIKLKDVGVMEIQGFYNDMYEDGLSANTIKHYHANIHKALKYAVKIDLVNKNESDKAEMPKIEKFEANYYNQEELMDLFDLFKNDRLFLVIKIAVYYGFRRSEVVGLKWDAIDLEESTITVKRKAQETKVEGELKVRIVKDLKNASSYRTLPLIPEIEDLLQEKRKRNALYAELLGKGYNHDNDDLICTDDMGNMITPRYVTDHFRYMIKKYGMKKIRFHDLRHSCASLLLANGVPMKAIQEWLGHSTYQTTADLYSHLDYESKKDAANVIANALGFDRNSAENEKPGL